MRSTQEIKTEIEIEFGFLPPFFVPALKTPEVLENLWQSTKTIYLNNPLPTLFKEKLSAYLGRFCSTSYFLICHSCSLYQLGMEGTEILELIKESPPLEEIDLQSDLELISQHSLEELHWQPNSVVEKSILRCAIFLFLKQSKSQKCINKLKKFLGENLYSYLISLIGSIKFYHQWLESYPEITELEDQRRDIFPNIRSQCRDLSDFLENYPVIIQQEKQKEEQSNLLKNLDNLRYPEEIPLKRAQQNLSFSKNQDEYWEFLHYNKNVESLDLRKYLENKYISFQEEENSFQLIFEKAGVGLAKLDKNGTIITINPKFAQILGYKPQQINGQKLYEFLLEDEIKLFSKYFRQIVSGKIKTYSQDIAYLNNNKDLVWTNSTLSRGHSTLDETKTIILTIQNISKRKKNEQFLKKRIFYLSKIINNLPEWVKLINQDGKILDTNKSGLKFLRTQKLEDTIGQSIYKIIAPNYRQAYQELNEKVCSGNKANLEFETITLNGNSRWMQTNAIPILNQKNGSWIQLGITRDITEEKLAKKALENLVAGTAAVTGEQFFPALVCHLAAALGVRYAMVAKCEPEKNHLVETIAFWGNNQFLDNIKYDLSHPDCDIILNQETIYFSSEKIATFFEGIEMRIPKEELCYLGLPLFDSSLNIIGHLCAIDRKSVLEANHLRWILNIFASRAAAELERQHKEKTIQELNEDLESKVLQRTLQLEVANQELEAFSYSVSHDLRAPLRAIDGFSKALREKYLHLLDSRGKHYLERVLANSKRMGELIDDLLVLSKISQSKIKFSQINLSSIVENIAFDFSLREPLRKVEWIIEPNVITEGDIRGIKIVIENLLNNAWKYTRKKTKAKIEFGKISLSDNSIAYFIRDNGAGFDMTYADKLFGPFRRLHSEQEFSGHGIGLATVKRIVNLHGGKVWATGKIKVGACFYFSLGIKSN